MEIVKGLVSSETINMLAFARIKWEHETYF
jgi:hypothetical protein